MEYPPIEDFETLLELRIKLKKYKEIGANKTLQILKRIKKVGVSRDMMFKIKISKTISHIAKLQFDDPTGDEANMLQYAQFLVNTWRLKMFKRDKIQYKPINYQKKKDENQPEQKPEKSSEELKVPELTNETRIKGLMGIKKYLKNSENIEEKKFAFICSQIEQKIFKITRGSSKTIEGDNVKIYKSKIKEFCGRLLKEKEGEKLCKNILSEKITISEAVQ